MVSSVSREVIELGMGDLCQERDMEMGTHRYVVLLRSPVRHKVLGRMKQTVVLLPVNLRRGGYMRERLTSWKYA